MAQLLGRDAEFPAIALRHNLANATANSSDLAHLCSTVDPRTA